MSVRPIDSFKAISFDCFGTLIDWRAGQRRVLEQFPSLRSHSDFLDQLIDARGSVERELQQKEWQPYETILEESIAQAVQEICGETLTPTEQLGGLRMPTLATLFNSLQIVSLFASYPIAMPKLFASALGNTFQKPPSASLFPRRMFAPTSLLPNIGILFSLN